MDHPDYFCEEWIEADGEPCGHWRPTTYRAVTRDAAEAECLALAAMGTRARVIKVETGGAT